MARSHDESPSPPPPDVYLLFGKRHRSAKQTSPSSVIWAFRSLETATAALALVDELIIVRPCRCDLDKTQPCRCRAKFPLKNRKCQLAQCVRVVDALRNRLAETPPGRMTGRQHGCGHPGSRDIDYWDRFAAIEPVLGNASELEARSGDFVHVVSTYSYLRNSSWRAMKWAP